MDRMKKVASVPKFGTLVLAAFALAAGAANRAVADPAAPAGPPDDAQIVQRILSLDRAEERIADAVKGKLASPPVWQLAQRMSVDHAAVDRDFAHLVATHQDSGSAAADGKADDVDLSKLTGAELEKAYVDREVSSHEAMLAALDRELIPNAKSNELQRRLIDLRSEVAAHLRNAQAVQHAQWVREELARQRADISREIGNSGP